MPSDASTAAPSITVVTCIESGLLETEVPLMVATLRRFGGPLANCRVIAARPRIDGLPLLKQTRERLDQLGVELIEQNARHRYSWWGFMNKPTALMLAAPHITTRDTVWLDGDTLIARPLNDFLEHPEAAVAASVEELGPVTTGPGNPMDRFWGRLAEIVGVPLDQLPWVTRPYSHDRIRIYFNAGVFRFASKSGFLPAYMKTVEDLLDARIVAREDPTIFMMEQLSFGLAIARLGLDFYEMDITSNFHIEAAYEECCPVERYKDVSIFHYHRALRNEYRDTFLGRLRAINPELVEIVESYKPQPASGLMKFRPIPRRLLYEIRRRRNDWFTARCTRV